MKVEVLRGQFSWKGLRNMGLKGRNNIGIREVCQPARVFLTLLFCGWDFYKRFNPCLTITSFDGNSASLYLYSYEAVGMTRSVPTFRFQNRRPAKTFRSSFAVPQTRLSCRLKQSWKSFIRTFTDTLADAFQRSLGWNVDRDTGTWSVTRLRVLARSERCMCPLTQEAFGPA